MANTGYGGLLGNMQANDMDAFPDQKKPAADLFSELGILSPSERRAQQLQQQVTQQLLAQQQQVQMQQMRIQQQNVDVNQRASAPQGPGFSTWLAMGGMQGLPNPATGSRRGFLNAPSQQPNAAMPSNGGSPGAGFDIDPSTVLSQELQSTPDDQPGALKRSGEKLLAIANARGDGDLQKIATNMMLRGQEMRVKADKEKATLAEQTQKTKLEGAQAGNPGDTYTYRQPNGDIVTARDIKDKDGHVTGREILGQGPNKQINQTIDDPRTATQKGAEYQEFQNLLVNSDATIASMRDIADNMEKGAGQGWAGKGVSLLDNVIGTLGQFKPDAKYTPKALEALSASKGTFQKWATLTGVNDSIWNDLVSNLAKTYNPTGTITEKDIDRAARDVGKNFSNPTTVAAILRDAERRTRGFVDRKYNYMGDDARTASKSQYERFLKQWTSGATGAEEGEIQDTGEPDADIDDNAPAQYASPKTQEEYDKLKPGQEYRHPDGTIKRKKK